ncbi:hypothetical protein R6Q57_003389 [Mikania cordata]
MTGVSAYTHSIPPTENDMLVQIDQKIEEFEKLGNNINDLLTLGLNDYPNNSDFLKRKNAWKEIIGVISKVASGLVADKGSLFERETKITSTFVQEMVEACENVEHQLNTSNLQINQPITELEEPAIDLDAIIPNTPFLQPENVEKFNEETHPEEKTPALEIRFQYKKCPREKIYQRSCDHRMWKGPCTIVFMTQTDTEFYKVMFESLYPRVYVHIGVLEAMMHVLNEEEKQRAPDVPEKQRKDLLNETMTLVLSNLKINHITKLDMIFIPIIKSEHVFLLVLDLKIPSFGLFDNMVIGDENVDRYEQIPTYMRDVFVNYLLDKDHPNAYKLYQQTPKIPDLPWKTTENGEDCGIFCMRHMETYMGGGVKGWKCGLLQEFDGQRRQLQQLRIKYLCKILTSTINILKDDIILQAREHDNHDPKKKQWPKTIKKMIKSRQTKFL